MKKILVLIILLISFTLTCYSAVYKINKDSTITNPNGQVQGNNPMVRTSEYNNQKTTNKDEVIYTKGQEDFSKTKFDANTTPSVINTVQYTKKQIKQMAKDNYVYTKTQPNINIEDIAKKYNRDPNAEMNKLAIQQNRSLNNGCEIITFSNDAMYYVRCNNSNIAYGYESVENPLLTTIAYSKYIDNNKSVQYTYSKTYSKWSINRVSIDYPSIQFSYGKVFGIFLEDGYYIDNKHYDLNGNYLDERYVHRMEY